MRHNWVPLERDILARCQYCYYILNNEVAKNKYKHYEKELKQNRERVHRCLVCHVNLCPRCEPIFHGVDLSNHTVKWAPTLDYMLVELMHILNSGWNVSISFILVAGMQLIQGLSQLVSQWVWSHGVLGVPAISVIWEIARKSSTAYVRTYVWNWYERKKKQPFIEARDFRSSENTLNR